MDADASTREVLMARAEAMAASTPWHEVTMSAIARACGLSRQTVYNEFGSKRGLAQAVALELTGRVLADVVVALESHDELQPALAAGLGAAFAHADASPLVHTVLTGQTGPDGLLTVLTTDAQPMLGLAGAVLTEAVLRRWPAVDASATEALTDAACRLVLSHLLQPGGPRSAVADQIAWMFVRAAGVDPAATGRRTTAALR